MPAEANSVQNDAARPKIAITVGDVAGVGPELAMRCAAMDEIQSRCQPILIGPLSVLNRIADCVGLPLPIGVLDIGQLSSAEVRAGIVGADTGRASYDAVTTAIELAMSGEVAAIVTGPIQKEAWYQAGIAFPGHTELLAQQTGTDDFAMMLISDSIACVLATIHIPLADVAKQLNSDCVFRAIRLADQSLKRKLGRPARVAVCGLNPHAGENGLFSYREEERIILPAIHQALQLGIEVVGPLPPDTAFTPQIRRQTDVYVCMYHDQGLIPLKALSFDDAVNVTLGLPIVRTSVDHGTALDLAWQGKANPRSMQAAIERAIELCGKEAS